MKINTPISIDVFTKIISHIKKMSMVSTRVYHYKDQLVLSYTTPESLSNKAIVAIITPHEAKIDFDDEFIIHGQIKEFLSLFNVYKKDALEAGFSDDGVRIDPIIVDYNGEEIAFSQESFMLYRDDDTDTTDTSISTSTDSNSDSDNDNEDPIHILSKIDSFFSHDKPNYTNGISKEIVTYQPMDINTQDISHLLNTLYDTVKNDSTDNSFTISRDDDTIYIRLSNNDNTFTVYSINSDSYLYKDRAFNQLIDHLYNNQLIDYLHNRQS